MAKRLEDRNKQETPEATKAPAKPTAAAADRKASTTGKAEKGAKNVGRKAVMRAAYARVSDKLANAKDPTEAIDDLVKLAKIEKDLGGAAEESSVSEVKVRWVSGEEESSKES